MYAGFLPKHAKWHAKLLMMDLSLDYISDSLSADLGGISGSLGRIAEFTDELQLRLDSLIIESFFEVNRQRIETLMVLREEIQSIRELISSERRALLAEVNRQRLETVEEVKSISISTLNGASDVIKDAIDHLIIRVVQMLLIVFLIALLIYYLYPRLKRKRLNQ
jgi:hypothetical protein